MSLRHPGPRHRRPVPPRAAARPRPAWPSPSRPATHRPLYGPRPRPPVPDGAVNTMILDEIAARVSGDMVNAGIASIDALWCSGQPLDRPLATYTRIAHAATRRHTAGLWTLIAWIYWRRNDLRSAWPALEVALDIDPDQDPPHYLAVFMHQQVDPARVPPVRFR